MGFFNYFGTVIIVSAFYSLVLTTVLYAMPTAERSFIVGFEDESVVLDYHQTSRDFQENLQTQKKFGITDVGALALFSGNIIVDLAGNFLFAIPSMFSLFFSGLFYVLKINYFLQEQILLWVKAVLAILSTIILLQFLMNVRTNTLGAV